jgi:hypothetical protein
MTPTTTPTPAGRIHGLIWLDLNRNGLAEPGEPGVAGVTIWLDHALAEITPVEGGLGQAQSQMNGVYEFANLTQGRYHVTLAHAEALRLTTEGQVLVHLLEDGSHEVSFGIEQPRKSLYLPLLLR